MSPVCVWRRRPDSIRRIEVLQTPALTAWLRSPWCTHPARSSTSATQRRCRSPARGALPACRFVVGAESGTWNHTHSFWHYALSLACLTSSSIPALWRAAVYLAGAAGFEIHRGRDVSKWEANIVSFAGLCAEYPPHSHAHQHLRGPPLPSRTLRYPWLLAWLAYCL